MTRRVNASIPGYRSCVVIQKRHYIILRYVCVLAQFEFAARVHAIRPLRVTPAPGQRILERVDKVDPNAGHHRSVVGSQTTSGYQLTQTNTLGKKDGKWF